MTLWGLETRLLDPGTILNRMQGTISSQRLCQGVCLLAKTTLGCAKGPTCRNGQIWLFQSVIRVCQFPPLLQEAPYGLYAEQLSGTAFTAPRT